MSGVNERTAPMPDTPNMVNVPAAIEKSRALQTEKERVQKQIAIVRQTLRDAVTMGEANAEQAKYVEDVYPVRERKTKAKA